MTIEEKLLSLSKSNFRNSFKLKQKDIDYINDKGIETIRNHAKDFINKRLSPKYIPNDGKQTPMKNHPVFIAQHATGTCCRKCLYKWHSIKQNKQLTETEQEYIVNIIISWIEKELSKKDK